MLNTTATPRWTATLCLDGDRALYLKRSGEVAYRPGWWNLPSGKVEPHDASLAAAARRELQEETGLVALDLQPLWLNAPRNGAFFVCRRFEGPLRINWESSDAQWLAWGDLTLAADASSALVRGDVEQQVLPSHAVAFWRWLSVVSDASPRSGQASHF